MRSDRWGVRTVLGLCLAAVLAGLAVASCGGDDEESCEGRGGVICNNCARDCDVECSAGQTEACVGLEYFGGDNPQDLRCAFCE